MNICISSNNPYNTIGLEVRENKEKFGVGSSDLVMRRGVGGADSTNPIIMWLIRCCDK